MSDNDSDAQNCSFFARKFNIPSIKSEGIVRWNKEWEKILPTLSASDDVYPMLSPMWDHGIEGAWSLAQFASQSQKIKEDTCGLQRTAVQLWDQMEEKGGHPFIAWTILDEAERKRHLMKGLQDACDRGSWGQDGRALCPEITLGPMLMQRGKGFTDFFRHYVNGKKGVGEDDVYFLPSEWWQKAVDMSELLPEAVELTYKLLSIQRNEFIARFLLFAGLSILHDLSHGSPGMDPVIKIMETDVNFANTMAMALSSMRDKPLIRCENCTKSSETTGTKFMVCSSCKAKLKFSVHYCSLSCQKDDWPHHKKHCGKKKILKNIKGTAQDPLWQHPDLPDHLRPPADASGNVSISSLGFGTPHPSHPHSPALQRQVSLITGDKQAEYFLFDTTDHPIRFAIRGDLWTKLAFRHLRSGAMFSANQQGAEAIAQYLIKVMGQTPGLSRERILDQFVSEYGDDFLAKFADWESLGAKNGYGSEDTFLDFLSRNIATTTPRMMEMHKQG